MRAPRSRRALVSLGAALVLTGGLVSGCGFGKATDRPYTPAWGANEQADDASALGMQIVAKGDGEGVLIGTLTNPSPDKTIELTQIETTDADITLDGPVQIPARGTVNLADEGGLPVSGDFKVADSDYVEMTLNFDGAQPIKIDVPIVPAEGDFEDFGSSSSSSSTPSASSSESHDH